MQHWLAAGSSLEANVSLISIDRNLTWQWLTDTANSKWNQFRLDSFVHDLSPANWGTSSNTVLASYLAPITWVTTLVTVSQGFFQFYTPDEVLDIYCHDTYIKYGTCLEPRRSSRRGNEKLCTFFRSAMLGFEPSADRPETNEAVLCFN
jgi:hypothetical protein